MSALNAALAAQRLAMEKEKRRMVEPKTIIVHLSEPKYKKSRWKMMKITVGQWLKDVTRGIPKIGKIVQKNNALSKDELQLLKNYLEEISGKYQTSLHQHLSSQQREKLNSRCKQITSILKTIKQNDTSTKKQLPLGNNKRR